MKIAESRKCKEILHFCKVDVVHRVNYEDYVAGVGVYVEMIVANK